MSAKKNATKNAVVQSSPHSKPERRGKVHRFTARLEPGNRALGWTIARVPFAPEALGKMLRLRVRGEIANPHANRASRPFAFRTSLFPDAANPGGYYLLVSRAMQHAASLHLGDEAVFTLAADLDPRPAELPDELAVLLEEASEPGEPSLRAFYDSLTEYMRREIGKWIAAPKSDEARMSRAEQISERLLATMEGERELPPAIAAAFRARPKARLGWQQMTPAQRRANLMAVFHYQSPEAREKRIQKLCDDAEKRA